MWLREDDLLQPMEAVSQNALSRSLQHEVLLFKAFKSRSIEIVGFWGSMKRQGEPSVWCQQTGVFTSDSEGPTLCREKGGACKRKCWGAGLRNEEIVAAVGPCGSQSLFPGILCFKQDYLGRQALSGTFLSVAVMTVLGYQLSYIWN